jgi:hypothetical protein
MNVKPTTIMGLMSGYYNECKKPTTIMGLMSGYYNECKKPTTIIGFICGYRIFENGFMEFIIKNDVSIICLKFVYCFKSL